MLIFVRIIGLSLYETSDITYNLGLRDSYSSLLLRGKIFGGSVGGGDFLRVHL